MGEHHWLEGLHDWQLSLGNLKLLLFQLPYVVLFELLVLYAWGVRRVTWRFVSIGDALHMAYAVLTSSAVIILLRLMVPNWGWGYAKYASVPLGIIAMNMVLAYVGVAGLRVTRRLQFERSERRGLVSGRGAAVKKAVLIGAGRAGQMVAKEINSRPDLGIRLVGFLDDDPTKIGQEIHGVRVLAVTADLERVAREFEVDEASPNR